MKNEKKIRKSPEDGKKYGDEKHIKIKNGRD